MKKYINLTTRLFWGGLMIIFFLSSCEPKEEEALDTMTYYLNGETEIDKAKFKETDSTVMVLVDSSKCYVFENENNLLTWTDIENKDPELKPFKIEIRTNTLAIRAFLEKAKEKGILDNDEEMQKLYDLVFGLQGPKIPESRGLGFLYEHIYYGGSVLAIAKYPKMPSGRDNWASSANILASTGLYDRTYFRGSGRWLIPGTHPNFLNFGFNDRTSSVF